MAPRIPTATTHTPNTGHRPVQSPSMGTVTKTGPGVWPPGVLGTALVPLPRLPAKSRGLGLAADRSGSVLIPPEPQGPSFFLQSCYLGLCRGSGRKQLRQGTAAPQWTEGALHCRPLEGTAPHTAWGVPQREPFLEQIPVPPATGHAHLNILLVGQHKDGDATQGFARDHLLWNG